jgi:hypothetical protein
MVEYIGDGGGVDRWVSELLVKRTKELTLFNSL